MRNILIIVYLLALVASAMVGLTRFSKMDGPARILSMLLIATVVSESLSRILVFYFKDNLPLFHIFSMIELFFCMFYFIKVINVRRQSRFIILSAVFIMALGICNIVYLQPINSLNTYMLIFEAYVIMAMSLLTVFYFMRDESIKYIFKYPHFWFCILILILWASSFCYWALYHILEKEKNYRHFFVVASHYQIVLNMLAYAGIGVVFTMNFNKKLWQEQQ